MNKKHWNTVLLDGSVPAKLIRELIDHSCGLIARSMKSQALNPKRRARVFVSSEEFSASNFLQAMFVNTTCTSSSSSTLSRISSTSAICSSVSSIGVVGMRSSPAFLVAMPRASMPWVSEAKSE